jgi:hypothetical protein
MPKRTGKETVRVQVIMDKAVADRVDELASILGISTSGMYALLVEQAVHDKAWLIKHVAAPIRKGLDRFLGPDWRERGGTGSAEVKEE